jgi:hypothetical protein
LDFGYAINGVVNYLAIVEDESRKSNSNQSYTIQPWNTNSKLLDHMRICCVNRLQQVVGSHDAHLLRLDLFKAQKNLGFW